MLKEMTQADLADATGYSERLIGKAESGKPVSLGAISALATVLSTQERLLLPEDLIANPLAIAREYIRCIYIHQQNCFEHMQSFLHDDIVFHVAGKRESVPYAGVHRGLDDVKKAFDVFWSCFEVPKDHDHLPHYHFFESGNEVVVWGDTWIHPIGLPLREPLMVTYRIQFQAGKLIRIDARMDTDYAATILRQAQAKKALH